MSLKKAFQSILERVRANKIPLGIYVATLATLGIVSHKIPFINKMAHSTGDKAFMGHDNPIEQYIEPIIEGLLNLPRGTLDLTPVSPQEVDIACKDAQLSEDVKSYLKARGNLT